MPPTVKSSVRSEGLSKGATAQSKGSGDKRRECANAKIRGKAKRGCASREVRENESRKCESRSASCEVRGNESRRDGSRSASVEVRKSEARSAGTGRLRSETRNERGKTEMIIRDDLRSILYRETLAKGPKLLRMRSQRVATVPQVPNAKTMRSSKKAGRGRRVAALGPRRCRVAGTCRDAGDERCSSRIEPPLTSLARGVWRMSAQLGALMRAAIVRVSRGAMVANA